MKTDMDALDMDERQRLCWLRANRAVLFLVGVLWLSMIAWELHRGREPVFLIAMLPVIALIRVFFYRLNLRLS